MSVDSRQKGLWLREFELNGFVLLRGFLPAGLVRALHGQVLPLVEGEQRRVKRVAPDPDHDEERLTLVLETYMRLLEGPIADPRFSRNPVIEELVDAIMGEGKWEHGWSAVMSAFPGSRHSAWHSDQRIEDTPDPAGPHVPARLTFNIPLVDFGDDNGATEVIPGSHHLRRTFLSFPISDLPNIHFVRWDLKVGDAVLRDGNMLHRGAPNRTDRIRMMLDQTYKIRMP